MKRIFAFPCLLGTLFALTLCVPAPAETPAEKAKALFDSAKEKLAETGDFKAALLDIVEANSLDPMEKTYSTHLLWIGRTQRLEALKAEEKDPEKWCQWCRSLNMFYLALGMKNQAIANDKELFAKSGLPKDGVRLAKAYYYADDYKNTAKVLKELGDDATPEAKALLVLATKQAGNNEEAVQMAKALECPEHLSSGTAYTMARVKAIAGDAEASAVILTALFEATAPSRLEGRKKNVVQCDDFDTIRDTEFYKKAMKVESKLSGCSEGKSCATCPMRNQCQQGASAGQSDGTDLDPTK